MPRKGYRTGTIDIDTAKEKFHEYYDKRTKSNIGRLRAKMFDMMYQKKPKFVLKPGQPGSSKYLLEEGPRTFDMEGVDYFPEGAMVEVSDPDYNSVRVVSRGSTFHIPGVDEDTGLKITKNGKYTSNKIYGPRVRRSRQLYSKHFKNEYKKRRETDDLLEKDLVEIYWQKYRDDPDKYHRKNKRSSKINETKQREVSPVKKYAEKVKSPEIIGSPQQKSDDDVNAHQFDYNGETLYLTEDLVVLDENYDVQGDLVSMPADMIDLLLDKKIILKFGDNTYIYNADEDEKLQSFLNPIDRSIIKIDLTNYDVFDETGKKFISNLQDYLDEYGISIEDLIPYDVKEEPSTFAGFFLNDKSDEFIQVEDQKVYTYPDKIYISDWKTYLNNEGINADDLIPVEESDIVPIEETNEPIFKEPNEEMEEKYNEQPVKRSAKYSSPIISPAVKTPMGQSSPVSSPLFPQKSPIKSPIKSPVKSPIKSPVKSTIKSPKEPPTLSPPKLNSEEDDEQSQPIPSSDEYVEEDNLLEDDNIFDEMDKITFSPISAINTPKKSPNESEEQSNIDSPSDVLALLEDTTVPDNDEDNDDDNDDDDDVDDDKDDDDDDEDDVDKILDPDEDEEDDEEKEFEEDIESDADELLDILQKTPTPVIRQVKPIRLSEDDIKQLKFSLQKYLTTKNELSFSNMTVDELISKIDWN